MSRPRLATLKRFDAPGYKPPDRDDLRAVMRRLDMNANQVAALVGLLHGRAVQRWLAEPTSKTWAPIPYAPWRLLLLEAKLVQLSDIEAD